MVGSPRKIHPVTFQRAERNQDHRLTSRRAAHRRNVDGSGSRAGSAKARNRLFPTATWLLDALCCLFPAMKAVVAAGRRPDRQDGEGLVARRATTPPETDDIVNFVMRLFAPVAVADDRAVPTERTPAWQQVQRERGHPGSRLSSASGSAIKRINGWREGLPLTVAAKFRSENRPSPSR